MSKSEYKKYKVHNHEVVPCLCLWLDLLGYGAPFEKSKWNLSDEICCNNFRRLEQVSDMFVSGWAVFPAGVRLVINDGFASTIDIGEEAMEILSTYVFLEGALKDFSYINITEKKENKPGVRGVITIGERFSHAIGSEAVLSSGRVISYFPKEFQLNTSFSKATIMEESGSRAGISGANLYIDREIFDYLLFVARHLGFREPSIEKNNKNIIVHVFEPQGWFADIVMDIQPVKYQQSKEYNNRGIETELYRFIDVHSKLDDMDKEIAWQRMKMLSEMEAEAENSK